MGSISKALITGTSIFKLCILKKRDQRNILPPYSLILSSSFQSFTPLIAAWKFLLVLEYWHHFYTMGFIYECELFFFIGCLLIEFTRHYLFKFQQELNIFSDSSRYFLKCLNLYMYLYANMSIFEYVYMCVCVCVFVSVSVSLSVLGLCVCVSVCLCVCMSVCMINGGGGVVWMEQRSAWLESIGLGCFQ